MFAQFRAQPERYLLTLFIALLTAPVLSQGLDRPLAHVLGRVSGGAMVTELSLVIAVVAWLSLSAPKEPKKLVSIGVTILFAILLGVGVGISFSSLLTLVLTGTSLAFLVFWFPSQFPEALDGLVSRRRGLAVVYVLAALFSIMQVSRVSIFMSDPTRVDMQLIKGVKFIETHSCLTAYVRADELARDHVDNLYLAERWPLTVEMTERPKTAFSPFDVDAYFYPPPFLLISEILSPFRGDFLAQRSLWFGLNGLFWGAALWIGARAFGGPRWHRPLLLAPLLFASLPSLLLLQIGNAQALVVILSIGSMLAFERDRPALGGFALALATMGKLSPGILGVTLIVQKRWRAVAWTAAFGVILLVVTCAVYGTGPIESWVRYALPRLSSGQAFAEIFNHPPSNALNLALSGLPYKFALFNIDIGDPWRIAKFIGNLFTLFVLVLAVIMGRRQLGQVSGPLTYRALAWMALLYLSALRSPYAPGYVLFSFCWAITLLSTEVKRTREGITLVVLFIVATVMPPMAIQKIAILTLIPQVTTIAVAYWLIARRPTTSEK